MLLVPLVRVRYLTPSPRIRVRVRASYIYTLLQNKKMRWCGVPPPPIIFERLKLPQQIIYRRKVNLSESPNHRKYWENILISRFYGQFPRSSRILGHFWKFEKISNSQNTYISYIILKWVIWRFQIYNLFHEKFKFRGFTKAFKNFAKYIIAFIFAKFKYFAKQIIYLESPDHPLQSDVCFCSESAVFLLLVSISSCE